MTFLSILLIAAMIAIVVVLVRGLAIFLLNASNEVKGEAGPSASALRSNKMMQYRVIFQGIAILIVFAIIALAGKH